MVAVERWPEAGMPPSPVAWIITTARNRAIDFCGAKPHARIVTPGRSCYRYATSPWRSLRRWTTGCA